jgi:hypothetical protein
LLAEEVPSPKYTEPGLDSMRLQNGVVGNLTGPVAIRL